MIRIGMSSSKRKALNRKPPWHLSRNPDMKIMGKMADFWGMKEKREENETMISMGKKANAFFFPGSHFLFFSFFPHDFHRKPPWHLSRNPDMKIVGRVADFWGTKEKREKNERMISMGKKANAFFFPGSHFLFLSFFPYDFHRKNIVLFAIHFPPQTLR
jgi:hypothetical protein